MRSETSCLQYTPDSCISWTGPDMPFFGIIKGQKYSTAIISLATTLQEYVEKEVILSCLYTGECDACSPIVKIPEAVQIIINKLCSLTSDDISNVGDLSCLGIKTMSPDAAKLLNRPFKLVVQPNPTGASVSFDHLGALQTLPSNFEVGQIRTRVAGTTVRGSSIIADSNKEYFTTSVKSDRFPLTVETEINILTPSGNVKLSKNAVISGTEANEHAGVFEVYDFSKLSTKEFSQTQVNELVAAEVCSLRSELDQYKNITATSSECVTFASTDIKDIVAALLGAVSSLCDRVKALEDKLGAEDPQCGNC